MTRPRIMVVEDDNIVAEDIKAMLEGFGYAVPAMAFSGEEAVKKALDIHPDLILMDISLKGQRSGVEAVEWLRLRGHIPVVYVSAYADDTTMRRAKVTEPFGSRLKPVDARELQTTIEMALYTSHMDKERQDSEQWLSAILRSLGNAVMATDTQGGIVVMNPRAEELTGWTQAAAVGRHVAEVLPVRHETTEALAENPIVKVLQEGMSIDLAEHRLVLVAEDGTERPIDGSATPIADGHGTIIGAVLIFCDITKPRQLQEQLVQAQKMEAIGQLVERIAHDFNDLLTVIAIYTELLLSYRHRHDLLERYATEIKKAVDNATALTSQLLTLSCKRLPQLQVLALNDWLAKMADVVRRLLGPAIELILVPRATMGYVNIDPVQLEQVIRTLVINAREAMSQGGTLTIETADIEGDERPARRYGGAQPGPYVRLAVSDTGCGMDTTTRARLFEPFFTTKFGGHGTGLGLSIVYGLVSQSGGHIEVDSAPGRGAVFSIYLPRVEPLPVVQQPSAAAMKVQRDGGGRNPLEGEGPHTQ